MRPDRQRQRHLVMSPSHSKALGSRRKWHTGVSGTEVPPTDLVSATPGKSSCASRKQREPASGTARLQQTPVTPRGACPLGSGGRKTSTDTEPGPQEDRAAPRLPQPLAPSLLKNGYYHHSGRAPEAEGQERARTEGARGCAHTCLTANLVRPSLVRVRGSVGTTAGGLVSPSPENPCFLRVPTSTPQPLYCCGLRGEAGLQP